MYKSIKIFSILAISASIFMQYSCHDDSVTDSDDKETDVNYIGKAVGNFSSSEWYPGGKLGTTDNVSAGCYEDEAPTVNSQGLIKEFKKGEAFFERNFNIDTAPFNGLGPASVRKACIDCHPAYGHGKRQLFYKAGFGNGYLLVAYHPTDGNNSNDGSYISEVTGMPQTQASSPFLPPIDEDKISIQWKKVTAMESGLPLHFPDGETFELIYPEVSIPTSAFNTDPKPTNLAFRIESTIGIIGSGLLDAIPQDSIKAQYEKESQHVELNPNFWDKNTNDFASGAWYSKFTSSGHLSDGTSVDKLLKRFTYALTRASLQDGPGANAIWNITNVSRSDRPKLYTTAAWATAMSKNTDVISSIKKDPTSPYYADGTYDGIAEAVKNLISPTTNQFNNKWHNFKPEMSDDNYYAFMVWHRGLSIPRARNLNNASVQRGKQLFKEMGCVTCHRPSWTTGEDNYWVSDNIKGRPLPKYQHQTIYPYSDMLQHRLHMINDIHGSWCRTTPLWGRGLSLINTGAEDRLHDCRARNEIEAIMWHAYSKNSDAYKCAIKFYNINKSDRYAVVKFIQSI
jgi:CxxC motif-containing protein (DUF1111 family)